MYATLINLQHIVDDRGDLVVAELKGIPFRPERAFWMYGVPEGHFRGGHANHKCEQVIVALAGNFIVSLRDVETIAGYRLNSPTKGLFVGASVWRTVENFSPDAICLILASRIYDERDYIRTWDEYTEVWGQ